MRGTIETIGTMDGPRAAEKDLRSEISDLRSEI
jgi:hypothetical protein